MKIWVIARSYPIVKNKMRGSFELEQAKMLANAGHEVLFLAVVFHPVNKVKKWGFCSWMDETVRVYTESVFYPPERVHVHLKKFQGMIWNKFLKKITEENGLPDVIHIHYPGMVTIADEVFKYQKKNVAVVATDHWSKTLKNTMDSFQRKQLIQYAKRADSFLCVSEPLKKAVQEISETDKEIQVVPNVVSGLFKKKEFAGNKAEYKFIAVGRLVEIKQFDKILQAFISVFKGMTNITLTIIGEGPERAKLEKSVDKYGIHEQVFFTGVLSREETAQYVMQADALICYSQFDTFGVPVIEAWACGKPVISSDCIGVLGYWDDRLGYIVPWNEMELLKSTMRDIYTNRDQYDAEFISEFAQKNFGEKKLCGTLLKIYEEAVSSLKKFQKV